jgi:hypothetical protein
MFNQNSISAVNNSNFSRNFRKPLYESYCFANIPGTLEKVLTGNTDLTSLPSDTLIQPDTTYDTVVLFMVDAFGWRFFERYQDHYPTLKRYIEEGKVSKITSQFPSTTAAHVTAMHTGQRVDQSGVFEWFFYEPTLDEMISPLPFAVAGESSGSLTRLGVAPEALYPNTTMYQRFSAKRVESHVFQSATFTPSAYGNVVTCDVTETHPFTDFGSALSEIATLINKTDNQKRYIYCYYGEIDSVGHDYGPNSPEFTTTVETFFTQLEQFLFAAITNKSGKTLIALTADHGQTDIDPATTVYINQIVPEMETWVKRNQAGKAMMPGGSARDLFVYVKDEYLEIAFSTLTKKLSGIAEVYKTESLITDGLFGDKPSELLISRMSNLCILPYQNDSVYWYEAGKFEQTFYGHHGGLTPAEMESIFAVIEL